MNVFSMLIVLDVLMTEGYEKMVKIIDPEHREPPRSFIHTRVLKGRALRASDG